MNPVTPYIFAFNAGVWGPLLEGRSDIEGYANSAKTLCNFNPTVEGPIYKRPGTLISLAPGVDLTPVHSHGVIPRLEEDDVAFFFTDTDIKVQADGDDTVRQVAYPSTWGDPTLPVQMVARNDILIVVKSDMPPHVVQLVESQTPGLVYDIQIGLYNIQRYPYDGFNLDRSQKLAAKSTGHTAPEFLFQDISTRFPDGTRLIVDTGAKTSTLYKSWAADGVYVLGDLVSHDGRVYIVTVAGAAGAVPPTHTEIGAKWGDTGKAEYLYLYGTYTELTVISQADPFATGDLVLRIADAYLPDDYTNYLSTNLTNFLPRVISGALFNPGPSDLYKSSVWAKDVWASNASYPKNVAFHNSRLVFAGSDYRPQTLWGSRIDDYVDFFVPLEFTADNPFSYTLAVGRAQSITWLQTDRDLHFGTDDMEVVLQVSEDGTPSFITDTTYGSEGVNKSVKAPNAILFVQRGGRKIREITYQDESKSYIATDLTRFISGAFDTARIKTLVFQTRPIPTLWVLSEDGQLRCAVYDWREQVLAWNEVSYNLTGSVSDILLVEDADGTQAIKLLVTTPQGTTLFRTARQKASGFSAETYLDAAQQIVGALGGEHNHFEYLEGQVITVAVQLVENGSFGVVGEYPVVNGKINVPTEDVPEGVVTAYAGLPYTATYSSHAIEGYSREGVAQGKVSRINGVRLRLLGTGEGVQAMDEVIPLRSDDQALDAPTDLYTGFTTPVRISTRHVREPVVTITHSLPNPCNVIGVMLELTTKGGV